MKVYKNPLILLLFVLPLFISGNCKHNEEHPSFIIKDESDKEIVVQFSLYGPISQDTCCMKPQTTYEYSELRQSKVVFPNSEKCFEEMAELMTHHPADTLYIGVFYLDDIETMSCDEFEQLFPIQKEWGMTLPQLEENLWTLHYIP